MAIDIDKEKVKHIIFELLKTDEEFRLAVAGLIGLRDILEELKRLREDFNKLYQKSLEHDKRFEEMNKRFEVLEKKLLEHDKRFEEMNRRFEAIEKKLFEHDKRFLAIEEELKRLREDFNKLYQKSLEHDKRFEIIERKLLEHDKRFEAIERKLLEHDKRFEAIERKLMEHDKEFEEIKKELARINDRLGALTESTYAKFILDMVMHRCAVEGTKVLSWERNARIDDRDIDLLVVTERDVFVVEIKVSPSHRDVDTLLEKIEIAKKHYRDKRVVGVLAGTRIGREVVGYALGKGVEVYSW